MFLRLKSLKFDFKYQYSHHASTFQILDSLQENPSRRPCHRRASASSMQIANHSLLDSITTIRNEGELANVRRLLEEARHHQHFTGACFCQQLAADRERESRGLSRARSGTCGCTKEWMFGRCFPRRSRILLSRKPRRRLRKRDATMCSFLYAIAWNPWRQSHPSASLRTTSSTESMSSAP